MTISSASNFQKTIKDFDPEQILEKVKNEAINNSVINFYTNKTVLITGGGGAIGSGISKEIIKMNPRQLILVDFNENALSDIQKDLDSTHGKEIDLKFELVSTCNVESLERVFSLYRPNIVIMAAAFKHSKIMEQNVIASVENNIFGTLNTLNMAEKYNADFVHLVSSNSAINPDSLFGFTMRMCENLVLSYSHRSKHTIFALTRFGNIYDDNGAIISSFKKQIANGGPITITDKNLERHLMTISHACQYLTQSISLAKNGDILFLNMGQAVKVYDLAISTIKLSGLRPGQDIAIVETGLRPGENTFNVQNVREKLAKPTSCKNVFIDTETNFEFSSVDSKIDNLKVALLRKDIDGIKLILKS